MMTLTRQRELGSIRPIQEQDTAALIELMIALQLFTRDEIEQLQKSLNLYFDGEIKQEFWIVDDDSELGLSGVVYCAPERMTDGTWNLYLIGIHHLRRHEGRGRRLLQRTEDMAIERGGRVLIIETSAAAGLENARSFYRKCGYTEEARIRDFYAAGEDKIVFWKSLLRSSLNA